ncbi:MAG: hypothetical protein NTV73_10645 [Hyphomicrobiales bacterium]|nr:hypothetical protein [Hyphomicrobiales bacterium]
MKSAWDNLTAACLVAALAAGATSPAISTPLFVPKAATAQSDIVQVRDGVRFRRGWHNGYRGYPNYRPGYRYNNGWWFPAGAFVAGALIGGALANGNAYYRGGYYAGGYYPGGNTYYPRYYAPAQAYYPPGSSYRDGYRAGYRDGYSARRYGGDITCTARLHESGKC